MTRPLLRHAVALIGALPLASLHAQVAPDAGQILNEQRRTAPQPQRPADPPVVRTPEAAPAAPVPGGLQVQLRAVRFSGATGLATNDELQARVQPSIGKTLGHAELQQLADALTVWLRGRGFLLARAYLPRQDLTAGTLEIALIDGRLQSGAGRIVMKAQTRIPAARLSAIAQAALPEGAALHSDDLERALLLINDLPGVSARSALERGDVSGTSKLVIEAREETPFTGSATLDNFGGRSTGSARVGGRFDWNDPLAIGDALGVFAYASEGTKTLGASYSAPITPSGWRVNAAASTLRYRVIGDLKPLALKGTASTLQLGASYPLLRTRERNASLQVGYEHKRLRDDGNGANLRRRELDNLSVALNGNRFDAFGGGGVTEGGIALTAGRADLSGNAADRAVDAASARTDGSFQKLNVRLSRVQSLGGATSDWSLYASMNGQLAGGNLDSSEKFILGGPSGVRAYPVGEAAGDEGLLASIEVRRALNLGATLKAQGFAFLDGGVVRLHHETWPGSVTNRGNRNHYGLGAIGVGLNVSAGAWSVRGAVAQAIGRNDGRSPNDTDADGRRSRHRAWLQAALTF